MLQGLQGQVIHGLAAVLDFINALVQRFVRLGLACEMRIAGVQGPQLLQVFGKFAGQGMVFEGHGRSLPAQLVSFSLAQWLARWRQVVGVDRGQWVLARGRLVWRHQQH